MEAASVPCDNRENAAAFPPSFCDGIVRATDTSDLAIVDGANVYNGLPNLLVKSITDV